MPYVMTPGLGVPVLAGAADIFAPTRGDPNTPTQAPLGPSDFNHIGLGMGTGRVNLKGADRMQIEV
jgi:hypothetical protein